MHEHFLSTWPVRREAVALVLIVGLALRLTYTLAIDGGRFNAEQIYADDASFYRGVGVALAEGRGFTLDGRITSWRAPGYPFLVSLFYRLSAKPLFSMRMLHCLLGALTPLLVYAIGRRLRDPVAGVLAAAGCAVSYELISQTPYVLTEIFYTVLFLVWILAMMWYAARPSPWRAVVGGLMLGLALLTRPALQLVPVVLLPWFLWQVRSISHRPRGGAMHWAVFCAGVIAVTAPWIVRNTLVHGTFTTLTSETGKMIYNSHSPGATGGSGGWHRIGVDWTVPGDLYSTNEAVFSKRMARAGIRHALTHPVQTIAKLPHTFWNMWRPWMSGASPISLWLATVYYVPVMLLAIAGALTGLGRRHGDGLLYLVIGYMVALHLALHGIVRHRYPLVPVFTLLAAFAVTSVWRSRLVWRRSQQAGSES